LDVLKEACSTYSVDIISPNCCERMSYEFDPVDLHNAMERDIYFELCYANAIRGIFL
jgi:RNase P/RNase MRP subunit p30